MGQATSLLPAIASALRFRPLLWVAAALVIGMALVDQPSAVAGIVMAAGIAAIALRRLLLPILVAAACLVGGALWAHLALNPGPDDISRRASQYLEFGGIVLDEPDSRGDSAVATVLVDHASTPTGSPVSASGSIRVRLPVPPGHPLPLPGQRLLLRATVAPVESHANPDEPGLAERLRRQGVFAEARVRRTADWAVAEPIGYWGRFRAWTAAVRRSFTSCMDRVVPGLEPALLAGIIFGGRAGLPEPVADMFSATGTSHVLAASGMNVGVVAIFVGWLLPAHLVPRRFRSWLILASVGAYTLAAGATPSVCRAALMVAILAIGNLMGRECDAASGIAAAGVALLVMRPGDLWDPGFQMSFAIVAMLLTVAPMVDRLRLRTEGVNRLILAPVNAVVAALAWSLAAMVAVSPLSITYFGTMPLVGVLANAIVTPLVAVLDIVGLALWPVAAVSPSLAAGIGSVVVRWPVGIVLGTVKLFSDLPAATLTAAPPGLLLCLAYYGLLALLLFTMTRQASPAAAPPCPRRTQWGTAVLWAASWAAMLLAGPASAPHSLVVTFLSVGQGDAAVIRGPSGQVVIIDTGRRNAATDQGRTSVVPFLRRFTGGHADLMAVTHADDDHSGGAASVITLARVDSLMAPAGFYRVARESADTPAGQALAVAELRHVRLRIGEAGTTLRWPDGVQLEVLGPSPGIALGDAAGNDGSLVVRVTFGRRSILFTGDAGVPEEQAMMASGWNIHADVLKLGHHGSKASTSPAFLDRVAPTEAIASVGAHNTYGHPNGEVVRRLQRRGIRIWRTDRQGAITVQTDGSQMSIRAVDAPGQR